MSFEFTESVGLCLPKIDESVMSEFSESQTDSHKLVIEVAAIHAGLTSNYNNYPEEELAASLKSWVDPYPKPIILNHDPESDPMGRVMAARMDKEQDGTPFSRLQVAVINPEAISKVLDGRFITGSVGGKATSAKCSICNTDWAKPSESMAMPCKHKRGQVYNGKLAFFNLSGLSWKEYSFVNIPADQKSGILQSSEDDNPEWVKSARLFSVNMSEEKILELTESEDPKDILLDLKKKEAHYTYMNVKGTFLTATAYDYRENMNTNITFEKTNTTIDNETSTQELVEQEKEIILSEENDMGAKEKDEDILSVAEQLSADLASEGKTSEIDLTDKDSAESSDDSDAKTETENTEVETKEDSEKDSSDSETQEQLSEVQVDDSTEEQAEEKESTDILTEENVIVDETPDPKDEVISALTLENDKLKKTLHFMLAERVVDTKISLGMVESSTRQEALVEHSERTASSLADAIRDLEKLSVSKSHSFTKESVTSLMESKALAAVEENENVIEEGEGSTEKVESPAAKLEKIFVDKLMNRRNS